MSTWSFPWPFSHNNRIHRIGFTQFHTPSLQPSITQILCVDQYPWWIERVNKGKRPVTIGIIGIYLTPWLITQGEKLSKTLSLASSPKQNLQTRTALQPWIWKRPKSHNKKWHFLSIIMQDKIMHHHGKIHITKICTPKGLFTTYIVIILLCNKCYAVVLYILQFQYDLIWYRII